MIRVTPGQSNARLVVWSSQGDSLHGLASLRMLYGIGPAVRDLLSWPGLDNVVFFEYTPLPMQA